MLPSLSEALRPSAIVVVVVVMVVVEVVVVLVEAKALQWPSTIDC